MKLIIKEEADGTEEKMGGGWRKVDANSLSSVRNKTFEKLTLKLDLISRTNSSRGKALLINI